MSPVVVEPRWVPDPAFTLMEVSVQFMEVDVDITDSVLRLTVPGALREGQVKEGILKKVSPPGLGEEGNYRRPAEDCPFFLSYPKALGMMQLDSCVRKFALVNQQLDLSVSTHASQKLID